MSEENTESPPAKRNNREVEDKEDDEEEKGDEPVVEELQPQPVPAVINNDSDSDEDTRPIAQRRVRRNVRPPGEWGKIRQATPVIPSESDDEDEEVDEDANVVVSGEVEPTSYSEAMNRPLANKWRDPALEEYHWHLEHGTWELVRLPP